MYFKQKLTLCNGTLYYNFLSMSLTYIVHKSPRHDIQRPKSACRVWPLALNYVWGIPLLGCYVINTQVTYIPNRVCLLQCIIMRLSLKPFNVECSNLAYQ